MFDRYGHEWPDAYNRFDHTSEENLVRADAYVQSVLSQEEHCRIISPVVAEDARRRRTAEDVEPPRSLRPLRREYLFSDRTNRPEQTPFPS